MDADRISAWTDLQSPTPLRFNDLSDLKKLHPLARSAKLRLRRIPRHAMLGVGISNVRVSVNSANVMLFSGDNTLEEHGDETSQEFLFSFNGKSVFSNDHQGQAFSGLKNIRFAIRVTFTPARPNFLSEQAIETFCRTLSRDILTFAIELQRMATDNAISRIVPLFDRFDAIGERYGTVIKRTLAIVGRESGADITAYCVPDERGVFVEYLHSINAKHGNSASVTHQKNIHLPIDEDVLERLSHGRSAQATVNFAEAKKWVGFVAALQSLNGLRKIDLRNIKNFEIILTPVHYKSDFTGVIMQIFSAHDRAFSGEASRAARAAASAYSQCSRWAWQFRSKKMNVDPIFQSNDTRVILKQAFIIMPFGEGWSTTVEKAVRKLLSDLGYSAIRADDMFGQNIMEDIWKGILRSEVVICDTTGRNPNVYYELGLCHAIGKNVILITQDTKDIPFDVRHLRHVVYSNTIDGFDRLQRGLIGFISGNP